MHKTDRRNNNIVSRRWPKWLRISLKGLAVLFILLVLSYLLMAWYINSNKKEVLASVTMSLNEDIAGKIVIGDMETTFLKGFPGISLRLNNVVVKDSLFEKHKRILLKAGEVDITLNTLSLLRGTVQIKKISISNAAIDIFTMADGYVNTSVFRKKKNAKEGSEGSFPELKKLILENVSFTAENLAMNKLYAFEVHYLLGTIDYESPGWHADIKLKALAKSMAFNTLKGSFIKEKQLDGSFDITFHKEEGVMEFKPEPLKIGKENFIIGARLDAGNGKSAFNITVENKNILWKNAANLLSPNITSKLMMADIKKPFFVKCDLIGDFNKKGEDPLILVNAKVKNNILETPGGMIESCSFDGVFTNEYEKGKGYDDPNSAIKLFNFEGEYKGIPFSMDKAFIIDLKKPLVTGDFSSQFNVSKLAGLVDENLVKFSKGEANVKLNYSASIVDFMIAKPLVNGQVSIKNADLLYVPRKLHFKDISVALDFNHDNLTISEIVLKTGKSVVNMKGQVKNFLNLYYTDPKRIVLNWEINSPQLHIGEFLGFLGERKRGIAKKRYKRKGNFTEEINTIFEKSNVDIKLRVDKLYYNRFLATNNRAEILLTDSEIVVKNAGLNHAGGSLLLNGSLSQSDAKSNPYKLNATIKNVDVRKFFYAFNNFGLESLKAENIGGYFSSNVKVRGYLSDDAKPVPRSIFGTVNFGLRKGSLINFAPVQSVGKFAFPFRDMQNITFDNLKGDFDLKGDKVTIHPMQINSSVLNMDVEGVYSFGKGTNINISVPLRNPEKDKNITDEEELAKRRNRGIVLHLIAADDEDGKVKVKLGKKKEED